MHAPVILTILGVIGCVLSIFIGYQEKKQYETVEQLRIAEAVDSHFGAVQDHLARRENLASVVAALFRPPALSEPNALDDFGRQIIRLVPDLQSVGWLPEVSNDRMQDALTGLQRSGMTSPHFIDSDGGNLNIEGLNRPLYPLLDVLPAESRAVLGLDAGSVPERLGAIQRARDTGQVIRTPPVRLVRIPDRPAIILYAPVYSREHSFLGVLGFGYRLDRLLTSALNASRTSHSFAIRVLPEQGDRTVLDFVAQDAEIVPATSSVAASKSGGVERSADFAGAPLRFVYRTSRELQTEGLWRGLAFAIAGVTLTGAAIAILGFMANRASALAGEVGSRRSAEERMKVLIHELNHRVRNVLSVAQAVVRLSFTSGYSLSEVQKTCEGRLQALANAMSLLTASDWKSVSLRSLITHDILPFADRVTVRGEDLPLKGRAAQTFALLFYELATNAAKHGAFTHGEGKALLEWDVDRTAAEPIFRLRWREVGGPEAQAPTRRGFGELLLRRIAPRDFAGRGRMNYLISGFEYELEAPLREIIYDEAKLGREKKAAAV